MLPRVTGTVTLRSTRRATVQSDGQPASSGDSESYLPCSGVVESVVPADGDRAVNG